MSEEADQSNERLLQMAIQLNHIRNDPSSLTSPFHCNLCKVPFSGDTPLLQHLRSTKHKKKVTQQIAVTAVLSPSSPETRLLETDHIENPVQESSVGQDISQISGDVKEALGKGHIVEDRGSTTSPYQCKLCRIPLSGLAPLQQHMKSAKHLKKASARNIYTGTTSVNLLEDDHIATPSQESLVGQDVPHISDVKEALAKGHIVEDRESTTSPYNCKLCLIPLSGMMPLQQHVKSAKHIKKVSARSIYMETSSTDSSHMEPSFETSTPKSQNIRLVFTSPNMVQQAINKGHVMEDIRSPTSPYQCKLCQVPFTGLAPVEEHVKSAKHLRKAQEFDIQTDSPDCSFDISNIEMSTSSQHHSAQSVNSNSSLVQDALNKEYIVQDHGSTTSPFQCKACNIVLSGLEPLEQHVMSAKHIKITMDSSMESISTANSNTLSNEKNIYPNIMEQNPIRSASNSISASVSSDILSPHHLDTANSMSNETDAVSKSFELGHVRRATGSSIGSFYCEICQAPLTGEAPLREHVNSPNHAKKLRKNTGAFDMSGLKTALLNISINEEVSPLVKKAVEDGHVCKDDSSSSGAYFCNICKVPLTGVKPAEQHIQGNNHLMRARQNNNVQNLPKEFPANKETEDSLKISETEKVTTISETLNSSSPTSDLPIWPEYEVMASVNPKQPDEKTYKNLSKPRGHVYIFNNTFENDPNNFRPGASCDSINLKYTFEGMGYKVYIYKDLSREKTYKQLDEIQNDKELEKVDSFIMVILSHGEDSVKFHASDMKQIHLDKIRYMFIDSKCPQLKGKPKLFMCNYCRGKLKEKHLQTDAPHGYIGHEAPADMVTIHASIDGFKAIRHAEKGTIFVQSLCETLAEHAHNTELRVIYRMLSTIMKEKSGTTPELQDYVFRDFYFNPISIE